MLRSSDFIRVDRCLAAIHLAQRDYLADCRDRGHDPIMLGFVLQAKIDARKAGASEEQIARALERGSEAAR